MANLAGFITPNIVQENSSGSPITLQNVQKDDLLVILSNTTNTDTSPEVSYNGITVEVLVDTHSTPSYTVYRNQRCYRAWWRWPWWRYYWQRYYWNGFCHWYNAYWCKWDYWCRPYVGANMLISRAIWIRAETDGTFNVSSSIPNGNISKFTVYHFRPQVYPSPGKTVTKVSWVLRAPQAEDEETSSSTLTVSTNTDDIIISVVTGNSGTTSSTPSGTPTTNLVNNTSTNQSGDNNAASTTVRVDQATASGKVTYNALNADVAQFNATFSADVRERYVEFPTTGSVYWVVVPVKVLSNFQRVYPKDFEGFLATASAVDPVSFGLEANFTRGNIKLSEDESGQVSVTSYEELHIYRFPNTVQIPHTVGDILLNDNELEAYLLSLKKGW